MFHRQQRFRKRFAAGLIVASSVSAMPTLAAAAGNRPDAPGGYVVAAENDAWVFRPNCRR
jgi:hypothetical protein